MSYYCFVQARYSSRRLRGKVLKKINRLAVIEILIKRLAKSKKIFKVIILTSNSIYDQNIKRFCKNKNIEYFSGPLNNVFLRFKNAIKFYKPHRVIRISADSPLLDWRLLDQMINSSKKLTNYDIISNVKKRTFPKGQSIEIFKPKIFDISHKILSKNQKEHVTKFFYEKKKYKIYNFHLKKDYSKFNLCVDNRRDLKNISKLINNRGIFDSWKNYVKEL